MGELPFVAPWIGGRDVDLDAACADGDARADLEQLEADDRGVHPDKGEKCQELAEISQAFVNRRRMYGERRKSID